MTFGTFLLYCLGAAILLPLAIFIINLIIAAIIAAFSKDN